MARAQSFFMSQADKEGKKKKGAETTKNKSMSTGKLVGREGERTPSPNSHDAAAMYEGRLVCWLGATGSSQDAKF